MFRMANLVYFDQITTKSPSGGPSHRPDEGSVGILGARVLPLLRSCPGWPEVHGGQRSLELEGASFLLVCVTSCILLARLVPPAG